LGPPPPHPELRDRVTKGHHSCKAGESNTRDVPVAKAEAASHTSPGCMLSKTPSEARISHRCPCSRSEAAAAGFAFSGDRSIHSDSAGSAIRPRSTYGRSPKLRETESSPSSRHRPPARQVVLLPSSPFPQVWNRSSLSIALYYSKSSGLPET
jgi:hypothetical protein